MVEEAEARARESTAAVERLTSDLTEAQRHEAAAFATAADAESRADVRSSSQRWPGTSSLHTTGGAAPSPDHAWPHIAGPH